MLKAEYIDWNKRASQNVASIKIMLWFSLCRLHLKIFGFADRWPKSRVLNTFILTHPYFVEIVLCALVNSKRVKAFQHVAWFIFITAHTRDDFLFQTTLSDQAVYASDKKAQIWSAPAAIDIFWLQVIYSNLTENLGVEVGPLFCGFLSQHVIVVGCSNEYGTLIAVQSAIREVLFPSFAFSPIRLYTTTVMQCQ